MGTVLLHGFLGSGKNLRTLAQKWLERDDRQSFLIPDLLGHGDSPPLPPTATLNTVAAAVLQAAEDANLPFPIQIVGHSLGGRIALACARLAPDKVSDVVLLDIGPGPIDPHKSESRQVLDVMLRAPDDVADRKEMGTFFMDQGLSPALSDWILMNLRPQDGRYSWRIDRHALDALHTTFTTEDLWSVVEAQEVPVHCAIGERSSYVPPAEVARLKSLGCDVHVLLGAGHYIHVDALGPLLDWLSTL
jgi:esterase